MMYGRWYVSLLCLAIGACNREKEAASSEQHVDVLPAGAPEAAPAATPASKIGTLPLLAMVQSGGKCEIVPYKGFNAISQDIRYEETFPPRFIKVGIGDSTRAYAPVKIDVTIRREAGIGQDESESIQVVFNPTGGAQLAYR